MYGLSIKLWQLRDGEGRDEYSIVVPETAFVKTFLRSLTASLTRDLDLPKETVAAICGGELAKFLVKEESITLDVEGEEEEEEDLQGPQDEGDDCESGAGSGTDKDSDFSCPYDEEEEDSGSESSWSSSEVAAEDGREGDEESEMAMGEERCRDQTAQKRSTGGAAVAVDHDKENRERKKRARRRREPDGNDNKDGGVFPCSSEGCGRIFNTHLGVIRHFKRCHRDLYCAVCKECHANAGAKEDHLCLKPHCCSECGRRFGHAHELKDHQLIHADALPHKCPVCQKAFRQLSTMRRHAQQHGEPRHVCHVCDKKFLLKQYLVRHLRTHTGEQPYVCADCGRKFAQSENLLKHARRRHGGKGTPKKGVHESRLRKTSGKKMCVSKS